MNWWWLLAPFLIVGFVVVCTMVMVVYTMMTDKDDL